MPYGALNPYGAAVIQHDMFYDGQAQAGPAGFARPGLIDSIKTLENTGKVLRWDAWAAIPHKEFNMAR